MSQSQPSPPSDWPKALGFLAGFGVLRHKYFRLLWIGQVASGIGQSFQALAVSWHIYTITDSTIALGVVALLRFVPFMAFSLVGGAVADAFDRRRLLLITQGCQMAVSLFLLGTVLLGIDSPWPLYLSAFLGGAFAAFDGPARQALVPNLVPREEIPNALTVQTLVRQTSTIIGPGLAGMYVAAFGIGSTFGVTAATYMLVLALLMAMRGVVVPPPPKSTVSNVQRIKDGLVFSRTEPLILLPLALDFILRTLGSPRGLFPVFARDIFKVGVVGAGWLNSATAVGGIVGGVMVGSSMRIPKPVFIMMAMYFIEALGNGAVGIVPSFFLAWVAQFVAGYCNVVGEVVFASIVQLRTPDHLRGRTTALTNMLSQGGPPLGQFEVGLLASALGPGPAVLLNGLAGAVTTVAFCFLPGIRQSLNLRDLSALQTAEERDEAAKS